MDFINGIRTSTRVSGSQLSFMEGRPARNAGSTGLGSPDETTLTLESEWESSPTKRVFMKITLFNERPMGINALINKHWRFKAAEAKRVHQLVWATVNQLKLEPVKGSKDIIVTAYFKNRPLDCDNILDKFYIDGLRESGLLKDDTMAYVMSAKTISKIDKDNPRVEIEII